MSDVIEIEDINNIITNLEDGKKNTVLNFSGGSNNNHVEKLIELLSRKRKMMRGKNKNGIVEFFDHEKDNKGKPKPEYNNDLLKKIIYMFFNKIINNVLFFDDLKNYDIAYLYTNPIVYVEEKNNERAIEVNIDTNMNLNTNINLSSNFADNKYQVSNDSFLCNKKREYYGDNVYMCDYKNQLIFKMLYVDKKDTIHTFNKILDKFLNENISFVIVGEKLYNIYNSREQHSNEPDYKYITAFCISSIVNFIFITSIFKKTYQIQNNSDNMSNGYVL